MRKKATFAFEQLGVTIDLDKEIGNLSVGQQQMVEIAKSFLSDLKILIMDEPTAALTERETERLFSVIAGLKAQGVGIIYISHRMEEIFKITDCVTVMRDGLVIDTKKTKETNVDELVRKMVGRSITDYYPQKMPKFEKLYSKQKIYPQLTLKIFPFQFVQVKSLVLQDSWELVEPRSCRAIFGIDKLKSGTIKINGKSLTINNPAQAIKAGIGFLTEDRKDEGLVLDFSIKR